MKRILKIVAVVVVVLIVIAIAVPFFIDANTFRPRLEALLTSSLGREVKVGNLSLSLFSGSVGADDISIADDPAFSKTPFVTAKSLKVGVEMMPLIFSKTLNVTELTLNQPEISLVKSENGEKWNFSSIGQTAGQPAPAQPAEKKPESQPAAGGSSTPNLSVGKLNVSDGRLTVSQVGSSEKPHVYEKVNITVTNFSFQSSFPFKMSAQLPGGGSLDLDGKTGPIDQTNAAFTPLEATVKIKDMKLAESGFIDPASGISGTADFDGTVTSDGKTAKTNGALKASNLVVAKKGTPAGKPVDVTYSVTHNLGKETGVVNKCDVAMGKAVSHLTGTYDAHGKVTTINMKLIGEAMPVDDLEAMIPALGIVLPPKATLKGGTLNTAMGIEGPVDKLVIMGTVKLENSALANFDLGSKLSSVSALAGKKTGNDTTIQNFSSDVKVAPAGTEANNINLTVPSIGVVTGAGTVSPSNELAFKLKADVGGLGVPVDVTGTTSDPKFAPDVKGLATGLVKGALGDKAKGITSLFGKKKPQ